MYLIRHTILLRFLLFNFSLSRKGEKGQFSPPPHGVSHGGNLFSPSSSSSPLMGKRNSPKKKSSATKSKPKKPKKPSSLSISGSAFPSSPPPPSLNKGLVEFSDSVVTSPPTSSLSNAQSIVSPTVLAIDPVLLEASLAANTTVSSSVPVKVAPATEPVVTQEVAPATEPVSSSVPVKVAPATEPAVTQENRATPVADAKTSTSTETAIKVAGLVPVTLAPKSVADNWVSMVKGSSRQLKKKGEAFTLDSGEVCVKIPNSVIERNKKAWDCFVLGQFYSDPPSQGTIHNIVNGIWSKQYRDVVVSKMEGNSFLFRIPNSFTRSRVLNQRLWQIEGQTMFVAKWEPGLVPVKPELTSAPIWLELRKVPLQFFHEEGLERIAGLVGDPKFLHPSTANRTNLEVAKVFTLIDPRKPLPEAVNVQFESGEIRRILVSSPFMPPVCSHCKQIGHSLKHCKLAPATCNECSSTTHTTDLCHRLKASGLKKQKSQRRRRSKTPAKNKEAPTESVKGKGTAGKVWAVKEFPAGATNSVGGVLGSSGSISVQSDGILLGTGHKSLGEASGSSPTRKVSLVAGSASSEEAGQLSDSDCAVEEDSSDILSTDTDEENFIRVLTKRQRRELRGRGLKSAETHVKQPKELKFINDLLPGWGFEGNYEFSALGKIWVLWDPAVKVVIVDKSLQMVTCEVLIPGATQWFMVSFVYAANEEGLRKDLWKELMNLASSQAVGQKPWIVLGDFNQVLHPWEHSKAVATNVGRRIRDFRNCLYECELDDLVYSGNTFTWWNKSSTTPVAKKIDRILVNDCWTAMFPSAFAVFGEPDFSDHACCGVVLRDDSQRTRRPFRFFNYLLHNPHFVDLIREQWYSINAVGSAMFRVSKKLKALKPHIRTFSSENYSDLEKRVVEAHELVLSSQRRTLEDPSILNANSELEATRKWHTLVIAEERFFCQKSRVTWLHDGDSNTSYFHRMADMRHSMNKIQFLFDDDGNKIDTKQGIEQHCADYFENLLGGDVSPQLLEQSDMELLLPYRCSLDEIRELGMVFTDNEIEAAFSSLPRNKTSGPDGYSSEFFKGMWVIVGPEVLEAVKEFFSSGQLLKQWNATTLVLIPKVVNASKTTDFRPISCLNTLYKVIAKLLSSRLKSLLSRVISSAQSAFLPGRLLAENVLLATEIVHGYNRKNIESRGMLKVDLRKAFDTVRWDFIVSALKAIAVPDIFINWIFQCISTPTFSISINGSSGGFFKSTRGLRQGDPLSPYLFVLAMEVFSNLLRSRFDAGYIHYHPNTSELSISHLMFADDVMVFFDGGSSSLHGISETLDDFASWSGLQVNKAKTLLYLAGTEETEALTIARYGFPTGSLPVRYLGLPLMCRKLKISEYEPLMEKLSKRFRSWSVKCLSFAGRVQLIASVITGIVNFWLSTFMLPKGCVKKIESLCSRFLWAGCIDGSTGAKIAWSGVCLPKQEGGVGLRRFSVWNKTLCLRFIWLLFAENESLWSKWHKFHHLKTKSLWELKESATDPWTWKMLLRLRHFAEKFIIAEVNNGEQISFWHDNWTPLGPLFKLFGDDGPRSFGIHLSAKVMDACNDVGWTLSAPRSDTALSLHAYLSTIPLPSQSLEKDIYCWIVDGFNCRGFSSSKTWSVLRPRDNEKDWASSVWFRGAVPRNAFNMWVSHLDRLPTRHRLMAWGVIQSAECCYCSFSPETRDHLMFDCVFGATVWKEIFFRLTPAHRQLCSWSELLSWTRSRTTQAPSTLRKVAAQAFVYHIWRQRNNILHNNQKVPPSTIFRNIDREIRNTISGRRYKKRWKKLMLLWIR
ncbi:Reverse transcriptase domain [Arabidopsis suecica]|uniref:Reverse transcriptase domain n=1 Tax=Arabidopsis suecica TaxID=45249 RepID=A0A8T1YPE1_ARASU|nr:Reverse transcriptase domain [Arabidopsis suecica]